MKIKPLAALLLFSAVAVGAWAQDKPDRQDINVTVVNGNAVVTEEPAHTSAAHGAIVWRIATPGYRFAPADGIVVKSAGKHDCKLHGDAKRYRCGKRGHIKGETYKYDVRLVEAKTGQALPVLDPHIAND